MKFFFDALGCPKALVDAEKMIARLIEDGHEQVFLPEEADAVVVNTCGFIESAKQESVDTILEYAELKKQKKLRLIVTGCLSERYAGELSNSIPEIDSMLGVRNPALISKTFSDSETQDILDRGEYKDLSLSDRSLSFSGINTAYLKISEGCNRACAFCAIPGIRGAQRCRTLEDILNEARFLQENGIGELIVIGEDVTAYRGLSGENLIDVLDALNKLDFHWIRLMYLFPGDFMNEIIDYMAAHPKICSYIDIPLQHASAEILKAMNRQGNAESYLEMINTARGKIPDIAIRSTFIVGFPGESESDVEILADFLKKARLDRVGFFAYSDEEGTPAYDMMPKIKKHEIENRIVYLSEIQAEISRKNLSKRTGRVEECVNDGIVAKENGVAYHLLRSRSEAPEVDGVIKVPTDQRPDFQFTDVKITAVSEEHDLEGVFVEI